MPVRSRLTAISLPLAAIASAVLLRLFPPTTCGIYPACPIHQYFGILCPGCGATRALAALLHGHLREAWHLNGLLLLVLPFALLYTGELLRRLWRDLPQPFPSLSKAVTCSLLAIAAGFTVARNLAL